MDKMSLFLILCSGASNAFGNIIMNYAYGTGANTTATKGVISTFMRIATNPFLIFALTCFGLSFFFMAAALSKSEMTFAYPLMTGFCYILVLLAGQFLFHEHITASRIAGIACIVAGIFFLAIKQ